MAPRRAFCFLLFLAALAGRAEPARPAADGTARPATPEELSLLTAVLQRTADDLPRWAYTEHRVVRDEKGKVKSEQLVRFDPSRPYAEQWTPLKIDGREPTEREKTRFRRRGEESDPQNPKLSKRSRPSLGEVLDVGRATVGSVNATHWVFSIPLRKFGNERFPPEKFEVFARIRKEGERLENVAVLLRDSFRSKLVVKVKSGDASIDFAVVDPKYPPTMIAVEGDASASVFFVSVGGSVDLKRTELRHVRPYDERFEVQIGNLKAIDF